MEDTSSAEPFLVLYFDVNQTIVMSDAAQSRPVSAVLDSILAKTTFGTMGSDGWVWDGLQPSNASPDTGKTSFHDALKRGAFGELTKEEQAARLETIGREGGVVEGVRTTRERLEKVLQLPEGAVGERCRALFKAGSFLASQPYRCIVPAFFQLVIELTQRNRRFGIVMRTFGMDLGGGLVDELNAFAEGRHPLYPDVGAFDGQNGRQDLRISLDDSSSHGSFYRDANQTCLVLGTLERPPPDEDLSAIGMDHFKGQDLQIISGHPAISQYIADTVKERLMLAYRDYWPWWGSANNEAAHAAKPMYIDMQDTTVHPIFFDDHAGRAGEDPHIVDVRDLLGAPLPYAQVAGVHVVRCEPLACLSDTGYFVKMVDAAEEQRRASC